jgi:predicted Kef-type K+ transport protein
VVPPAPIEVPLPVAERVVPLAPAVVSVLVLGVVAMPPDVEPVPLAVVLLVVSLGDVVVDGIVLELLEVAPVSSCFLLQALSERAAIRASAAHCAIGDLIIQELLECWTTVLRELAAAPAACGSL